MRAEKTTAEVKPCTGVSDTTTKVSADCRLPDVRRLAVSVREVSQMIGIGRTKIFELLIEGDLTAVRIGRRTLVAVSSIYDLVERNAQIGRR